MNKKLRRLPDWIEDIRGAIKNIREDIKGLTKGQLEALLDTVVFDNDGGEDGSGGGVPPFSKAT